MYMIKMSQSFTVVITLEYVVYSVSSSVTSVLETQHSRELPPLTQRASRYIYKHC